MRQSCVCGTPQYVDLTAALHDETPQRNEVLYQNLYRFGWSYVCVDPAALGVSLGDASRIHSLFEPDVIAENNRAPLVYRSRHAESGSVGHTEPKQSWEISANNVNVTTGVARLLYDWMNAMRCVARAVARAIGFPSTLMSSDSSDLLRVFLYDAGVLGSSPHTDWGSWTVVWQDDVGGLQTYCPVRDRYTNVSPLGFVVHVGDVTSLAWNHARPEEVVRFPSPRHRVVCPKKRASLVCFLYPPPNTSIQALANHWSTQQHDDDEEFPYHAYSLLHNQSPSSSSISPKENFVRIRNMPLGNVFREKWQQVQRS